VKSKKGKEKGILIVQKEADEKLLLIKHVNESIEELAAKANAEMEAVLLPYKAFLEALNRDKSILEKSILSLMKIYKDSLFADTDIVNLLHGSLIREKGEKVSLPKSAAGGMQEKRI